ncbi:transcription factor TFIIIB component B'' homolog isoform X2 [Conger conger]|uniref:transcription factor TFIIIB component B'' homolog isoform X2 n=1 Tax=Conger conger TaxID=82655 RepID=UPI002A5AF5A4|nr:transcription factor TFIIIB component B'' homolog isoform X2 [Conger conger]
MMRRSRISVRPNVRPGARALTSSQDGQSSQAAADTGQATQREDMQSLTTETEPAEDKPDGTVPSSENLTPDMKKTEQSSGGSDTTASVLQRRKRFSALPNLAKPRVTIASSRAAVRLPKTPPSKVLNLPSAEALTSMENSTAQGLRSPRWRRASGGGKPSKIQGKLAPLSPSVLASAKHAPLSPSVLASAKHAPLSPSVLASAKHAPLSPSALASAKHAPLSPSVLASAKHAPLSPSALASAKHAPLSPSALASGKQAPLSSTVPAPGPVPEGRKENETSGPPLCTKSSELEKSSQEQNPLPEPAPVSAVQSAKQSATSDRERIRKLRELIKQEQRKQKKRKSGKSHICEHSIPQDHHKMTMRDLIYYLPESNPMKSYSVEENRPAEKVISPEKIIPPSPNRELPEQPQDLGEGEEEQEEDEEEDQEGGEPAGEDQLVVPRVKVAEDGTLILDEESLTVEVLRTKGPNLAEENDPIFERGSSTTYSSFRKTVYTKPWSNNETEMFFMAISMVGTDFSLIGQLFPHRARTEIKNKFKKEERENSWRIDKAFKEKRRFDLEFFSKHLERVLAEEARKRKKSKTKGSVGQKNKTSIPKGRNATAQRAPSDRSASEELDSDVVEADSETAEKENEDCTNVAEAGANTAAAKTSHKRKSREGEETPHERSEDGLGLKKNRLEADEGDVSEDCEGPVCDVPAVPDVDGLKKPESSIRGRGGPEIKPAQLSRGRFQRPTPNLGARWAKKMVPQPREKSTDVDVENSSSAGERLSDPQEQNVHKPTRREQKRAQKADLVNESSSASTSYPKGVAPKGQGKQTVGPGRRAKPRPNLSAAQKKPKLVTLRASLPEDNEEEEPDETHPEEDFRYPINPEEQNQAPAFVPLSLRSPQPVPVDIEETMEELEISMNVSDVLGTAEPEHALCAQPVCPGAQDELVVSTDHQLDLLVDVIEFLSPDHVAGSEESYNEAARTLLTIRNPELLSLAAPAYSREVIITEESHHVLLDETEPGESLTSESTDQLQCGAEQPQTASCDLPTAEASQSATLSMDEMDSITLTPVEEFGSESVRSEVVIKTQRCETSSLEHTTVPEESHSQERAAPACTGGTHDGALGPDPSVQNVLPSRRSRFPKPKPNLLRTTRTPRVTPAQCTENSALAPVETEAMGSSPKERGRGSQESKDMLCQEEATCVGDSLGEQLGSGSSNQSVPPDGSARQLPKPVMDRGVRGPCVTQPLSSPLAPCTAYRLTEEGTSASSVNGMRAEMDKNRGHTSAEDRRTTGQSQMNLVDAEEAEGTSSLGTKQCSEDGGGKIHETSVSIDTVQEAASLHADGSLSAAVSCHTTEGQPPTYILTLFEVSPPLLGGLDSGADAPGTITAELLSPLLFVDEQLVPPATQTETHSCGPLVVEMCGEHGQEPHPLAPVSEEQEEPPAHSSIPEGSGKPSTSHSMASPVDSCESISLTVVPSDESGAESTSRQASPPLKKRKMPVRREKDHLQVKPCSGTRHREDPTEDGQTIFSTEHLQPTPDQTSPQGSSPHPTALNPKARPRSPEPGPSATEDPPQGIVGCSDLPEYRGSATITESTESSSADAEPQISQQAVPVTSSGLLTRAGRKPRGFLSFISDKSTARPAGAPRSARPACPRPQVNTSRTGRRAATVSTPPSRARPADSPTAAKFSTSPVSASVQDEASSVKASKTDKEPTSVSEFFFSDIFTQVEEPE